MLSVYGCSCQMFCIQSILETADLLGFGRNKCLPQIRLQRLVENKGTSSEWYFPGRKHQVDERGQRGIARLVPADRKSTVMQKSHLSRKVSQNSQHTDGEEDISVRQKQESEAVLVTTSMGNGPPDIQTSLATSFRISQLEMRWLLKYLYARKTNISPQ